MDDYYTKPNSKRNGKYQCFCSQLETKYGSSYASDYVFGDGEKLCAS